MLVYNKYMSNEMTPQINDRVRLRTGETGTLVSVTPDAYWTVKVDGRRFGSVVATSNEFTVLEED